MVEEVIWSPLAVKSYDAIIEYISEKFGEIAVNKFVQHIDNKIRLIRSSCNVQNYRKKTKYLYNQYQKKLPLLINISLLESK